MEDENTVEEDLKVTESEQQELPTVNPETPTVNPEPKSTENADFDAMVNEATATIEQKKQDEQQATPKTLINEKQAAEYALQGLQQGLNLVSAKTGQEITLDPMLQMLFATLCTPCIMKHGDTVMRMLKNAGDVDMDSYVPEAMAVGGLAVAGIPVLMQIRKGKQANGEKRKQSVE